MFAVQFFSLFPLYIGDIDINQKKYCEEIKKYWIFTLFTSCGKGRVSCRMRVGTQMTPTLTQTMAMATWVLFSVLDMDKVGQKTYC